MLCWISIVGGLLIMMGQHDRSEALFYYFRLDDQVPAYAALRGIETSIGWEVSWLNAAGRPRDYTLQYFAWSWPKCPRPVPVCLEFSSPSRLAKTFCSIQGTRGNT
jgi:hypothetical protein